jgi:hypothetical protein
MRGRGSVACLPALRPALEFLVLLSRRDMSKDVEMLGAAARGGGTAAAGRPGRLCGPDQVTAPGVTAGGVRLTGRILAEARLQAPSVFPDEVLLFRLLRD